MNYMRNTARIVAALMVLSSASTVFAKTPGAYNDICGGSASGAQKKAYCDAAKISYKAADDTKTMMKVWAGVAAVCTAACVAKPVSGQHRPWLGVLCQGSNIAGGVASAAVTKNYAMGLMGLAAGAFGLAQNPTFMSAIGMGEKQKSPREALDDANATLAAAENARTISCSPNGDSLDCTEKKRLYNLAKSNADSVKKSSEEKLDWNSCLSAGVAAVASMQSNEAFKKNSKMGDDNTTKAKALSSAWNFHWDLPAAHALETPACDPDAPSASLIHCASLIDKRFTSAMSVHLEKAIQQTTNLSVTAFFQKVEDPKTALFMGAASLNKPGAQDQFSRLVNTTEQQALALDTESEIQPVQMKQSQPKKKLRDDLPPGWFEGENRE